MQRKRKYLATPRHDVFVRVRRTGEGVDVINDIPLTGQCDRVDAEPVSVLRERATRACSDAEPYAETVD